MNSDIKELKKEIKQKKQELDNLVICEKRDKKIQEKRSQIENLIRELFSWSKDDSYPYEFEDDHYEFTYNMAEDFIDTPSLSGMFDYHTPDSIIENYIKKIERDIEQFVRYKDSIIKFRKRIKEIKY